MNNFLADRRRSGVLAHISSLPSRYGIGDIGNSGYDFLDFLAGSSQSCWQFLPLNPTNSLFDNSPYMSTSAFAGSPLLISPDLLFSDSLITRESLDNHPHFSPYSTDFKSVEIYKKRLLGEAYSSFKTDPPAAYRTFCSTHKWLDDYALFMALKNHFNNRGWFDWPTDIAKRKPETLADLHSIHSDRAGYYKFEQYIFYDQWKKLREAAQKRDILLFGDIPIYVGLDSVDVWTHQDIFTLDENDFQPTLVSGVPPDYFSETGQRWGNPLYRWASSSPDVQQHIIEWWVERFSAVFELVDIARIDHFRAFESYWAIPAENETAIDGTWLKGPGVDFFNAVHKKLGELKIVAEDLGIITQEVHNLRDDLGFPGMKVLQFAFDGDPANSFLPCNFTSPHCVVYTGTHDNDTTVGWFLSNQLDDNMRQTIKQITNRTLNDHSGIHNNLMYLALSSISSLAILPLQDILGFGNDCKMNSPGVPEGNWIWRCSEEFLTEEVQNHLKFLTELFNRGKKPNTATLHLPEERAL